MLFETLRLPAAAAPWSSDVKAADLPFAARFEKKVQFISFTLQHDEQRIPPPYVSALFVLKMQLVTVKFPVLILRMAPPPPDE